MGDQQALAGRITFALAAASAGVQALQQALKDAPDVVAATPIPDMNAGAWNYLPLALVSLAALIWISERMFRVGERVEHRNAALAVGKVLATVGGPKPDTPEAATKTVREFLPSEVTYADLLAKTENKTDLQKQVLSAPYLGKWMRSTAIFSDVTLIGNDKLMVFAMVPGVWPGVSFLFDPKYREQIAAIHKGDQITVDGCLKSLTSGGRFDQCELVDVRPPPPKPAPKPRAPRKKKATPRPSAQ